MVTKQAPPSEGQVRAALLEVEDPELPISVVDLGLVRGIDIEGRTVTVRMTFTSIACPCTDLIKQDVADRVGALPGVTGAVVEEVFEGWSRADISAEGRQILRALAVV
jgi:metal-sulfur cluster biosynthetic enzyme